MSRQIDLTKKLSKDDRRWLKTNGRTADLALNKAYLEDNPEHITETSTPDLSPGAVPDAAPLPTVGQTEQPVPTPDQADLIAQTATEQPTSGDGDQPEADNYDDEAAWSYKDLQDEVRDRNVDGSPALNSGRASLIEWLRADDADPGEQPES